MSSSATSTLRTLSQSGELHGEVDSIQTSFYPLAIMECWILHRWDDNGAATLIFFKNLNLDQWCPSPLLGL
jgi:hypothetical protein